MHQQRLEKQIVFKKHFRKTDSAAVFLKELNLVAFLDWIILVIPVLFRPLSKTQIQIRLFYWKLIPLMNVQLCRLFLQAKKLPFSFFKTFQSSREKHLFITFSNSVDPQVQYTLYILYIDKMLLDNAIVLLKSYESSLGFTVGRNQLHW